MNFAQTPTPGPNQGSAPTQGPDPNQDSSTLDQSLDFIMDQSLGVLEGATYYATSEAAATGEALWKSQPMAGPLEEGQKVRPMDMAKFWMDYEDAYNKYSEIIDGRGSWLAETAGAAGSAFATGNRLRAAGGGLRAMIALGAAEGTAVGAAGSDPGHRTEGAQLGLLFGLVGGHIPIASAWGYETVKGLFAPGRNQLVNLLNKLAGDVDWEEILDYPGNALADLSAGLTGLVGRVSRDNPQVQQALETFLGERLAHRLTRTNETLSQVIQPKLDSTGIAAVSAARQNAANPMYEQAYKPDGKPIYISHDPELRTPEMNEFLTSPPFLARVKGMLHGYKNVYKIDPVRPVMGTRKVDSKILDPQGKPIQIDEAYETGEVQYSLAFIDDVAKELGQTGDKLFKGSLTNRATRFSAAGKEGRVGLESVSDNLTRAQTFAGQKLRMNEAYEAGKKAVGDGVSLADVQKSFKKIQEEQAQWLIDKEKYGFATPAGMDDAVEAFRSGFAEGLYEAMHKRNVNYQVLKDFQDIFMTDKMGVFMSKGAVARWKRGLNREMRQMLTARAADPTGSITGDIGGEALEDAFSVLRTSAYFTPWAGLEAAQKIFNKLRGPGQKRFEAAIGDALMNNDPALLDAIVKEHLSGGTNVFTRLLSDKSRTNIGEDPE